MGLNWSYLPIFGFPLYEADPTPSKLNYNYNKPKHEKADPKFSSMPMNPALGQRWMSAESGKYYIWDGLRWALTDAPWGFTSSTPPVNPKEGDLWFY
jgi:hypothetical protein